MGVVWAVLGFVLDAVGRVRLLQVVWSLVCGYALGSLAGVPGASGRGVRLWMLVLVAGCLVAEAAARWREAARYARIFGGGAL